LSNPKYSFISAYLKGEEAKTVTHEHINKLPKSPNIDDIMTAIDGTDIGNYLEEFTFTAFDEVDGSLLRYLGHCITRIEAFRYIPDDVVKILKVYIGKYDILNIKGALQRVTTGKKMKAIPIGTFYDSLLLDNLIEAETIDEIVEVLDKCNMGEYSAIVKEYKPDESSKSRLMVESQLDGIYYRSMFSAARKIKDGYIFEKALGTIVDMTNLQVIVRAIASGAGIEAIGSTIPEGYLVAPGTLKELLSSKLNDLAAKVGTPSYRDIVENVVNEYGRTQNILSISATLDKNMLELLRGTLSPRIMSPLMIAWYLLLKENEIRNLRLVFKAQFDRIPLEEIKDYLVYAS
jgi:vacuolar-type H+-ATPase subunit C/Vma6